MEEKREKTRCEIMELFQSEPNQVIELDGSS
jgi:hypothetical protein